MRSIVRSLALLVLAGVPAAACGAAATSAPTATPLPTATPTAAPTASPTPTSTPTPTARPTPTPTPTPIAYGPAVVVEGIESCTTSGGTESTDPDGTTHSRGTVLTCTDTSNDPRVSGTVSYTWNYDLWGSGSQFAHVQWGAGRLENAGGAWEGTYTGSFSSVNGDVLLFWFKGTGGYEGLSYGMWAVLSLAEAAWTYPVRGVIFPGPPPAP